MWSASAAACEVLERIEAHDARAAAADVGFDDYGETQPARGGRGIGCRGG